ncbi:hypothetical protein AP058_02071 [Flavobacterium sp. TAB 87]|nr:hypothetical protein AP058_02071 [Flavobacterium sp. TAB 87]
MPFSSFKNIPPLVFYFASIICFVTANVSKDKSLSFYYILLGVGLVLFLIGLLRKLKR